MSELAKKLIEENRRTKAKFLDLGRCGLTEVPAEVGELVWLESLSLADQWYEWGPGWESRLSSNAGASNRDLNDLNPLAGLSGLRSLHFRGTKVSDLRPLAGLASLQTLSVSAVRLSDLGPLAGLASLQVLA